MHLSDIIGSYSHKIPTVPMVPTVLLRGNLYKIPNIPKTPNTFLRGVYTTPPVIQQAQATVDTRLYVIAPPYNCLTAKRFRGTVLESFLSIPMSFSLGGLTTGSVVSPNLLLVLLHILSRKEENVYFLLERCTGCTGCTVFLQIYP